MIRTESVIGRVWLGVLLLLLGTASTSDSTEAADVEQDAATAIDMLSKTAEAQVSRVLEATKLIQCHPKKKKALTALIPYLDDPEPTRRRSAVHFMQTIPWDDGSPAFPALRKF